MQKELKLIELYYLICDKYRETLQYDVQRFSPNHLTGNISDEEIITLYLFSVCYEQRFQVFQIYTFIYNYWYSWFPTLPSYQAFNTRLNRLAPLFPSLVSELIADLNLPSDLLEIFVGDSMPIITCKGNRKGKVAQEITSKGYCATKKMHYFGVKLHCLALRRCNSLPLPNTLFITPASTHDLTAMRSILEKIKGFPVILDKAYNDKSLSNIMLGNKSELVTPIKELKGATDNIKKFDRAYNDKYNTAVSKLRQSIESFFNWINEKTQIQIASKIRSENGLIVHVFGKLAAAILLLK